MAAMSATPTPRRKETSAGRSASLSTLLASGSRRPQMDFPKAYRRAGPVCGRRAGQGKGSTPDSAIIALDSSIAASSRMAKRAWAKMPGICGASHDPLRRSSSKARHSSCRLPDLMARHSCAAITVARCSGRSASSTRLRRSRCSAGKMSERGRLPAGASSPLRSA
eukprot:scaffold923_cov256-Pinguiococcus_pyrenoidosus.AAC.9